MEYYELLGVRRSATAAEIRRAYQKLARRLHPDLNPGDPAAAESFRAATRAFEVLSDAQRRAAYDRGERPAAPPPPVAAFGFEGFDFSVEVKGRGAGFQELFDSAPHKGPGQAPLARGEDLEQATRVSFEEALHGASRRIHLVRHDRCPACDGHGDVAFGPVPCPRCRGTGQLRTSRGHMIFSHACGDCGATGVLDRRPCPRCGSEGRVMQSEWLEVRIPPGAGDGTRIRLPECGNVGPRGGPAGDFVLVIEIEAHPFYRREGDDLCCTLPVSMVEAALGAHVEVPTPEGPVTIEIPAGTQTGQRFRLRKRGLPRLADGVRGDLYVEARVEIPALTDGASRELLQEIARRNPADPRRDLAALLGSKP
jgi:molecular chaperone DnaJ